MITEFFILLATIGLLLYIYSKFYGKIEQDYFINHGVSYLTKDCSYWDIITRKKGLFEQNYYQQLKTLGEKFGCFTEFRQLKIFIADTELYKRIFIKDFESFMDRTDLMDHDPFASQFVSVLHGQEWKEVRAFLTPTFTSGKIRRMFEQFNKSAKGMLELVKMQSKNTKGYIVTIPDISKRFTMDVIGSTAFGFETNVLKDPNSKFYKSALRLSEPPKIQYLRVAILTFFPKLAKWFKISFLEPKVVKFFKDILRQAMTARETSTDKWDDFLQLMLEAKDGKLDMTEKELEVVKEETDELKLNSDAESRKFQMSEEKIMAQSFLFFFAGFDTVSGIVGLSLYALAAHPESQEKVYESVQNSMKSDGEITYDSVSRMEYLDMFVSEVMRLYQGLPRLERKCTEDYKIPGTDVVISKGMIVSINPDAIHRDPEHYPDPEEFRPERFTAEEKAKRNPYVYLPFGIGPRNCIGMRFGLIQCKVAIAHLLHNFKIEPAENTPIPIKLELVYGVRRAPRNLELCFVPRN